MATLTYPGVSVTIQNDTAYAASGPGTVPLFIVATTANKPGIDTTIASYTNPINDGKLYLATSQRDLTSKYGAPYFWSSQGTTLYGNECNEFGLHAAFDYLSSANRAYILRAPLDLKQLLASSLPPRAEPVDGTYWLDTANTKFGIFQSTGSSNPGLAWVSQPIRVTAATDVTGTGFSTAPKSTVGADGEFAIVVQTNTNSLFEKVSGTWFRVGSSAWKTERPTTVSGTVANPVIVTGNSFSINGSTVTIAGVTVNDVAAAINTAGLSGIGATVSGNRIVITNASGTSLTLANVTGTPLTALGITPGITNGSTVYFTNNASYPANSHAGDVWFKGSSPAFGMNYSVKQYNAATTTFITATVPVYAFDSTLTDSNLQKDAATALALSPLSAGQLYLAVDVVQNVQQLRRYDGTAFSPLVYEASANHPTSPPEDGTYWFSGDLKADIMVNNGQNWVGYAHQFPNTDPLGVIIASTAPTTQSAGTALVDNDLWIDASNEEVYPLLNRYDATAKKWRKVDTTDQTTPLGCLFADARADSGPAFTGNPNPGSYAYNSTAQADLTLSSFVDPDAPNPQAHPTGMLLFNMRASLYNVKVWRPLYFAAGGFDANEDFTTNTYSVGGSTFVFPTLASSGRWVTASGNNIDGSPAMGRHAQRAMVVRALSSVVNSNQDIRADTVYFNLIACPGYPELLDEMVSLNIDQNEVAFVVADTPMRLKPDEVVGWATNTAVAPGNGEKGLITKYNQSAVYYPWGLSTNVDGAMIMVPPSTMALKAYAYNDQVSYVWYAPFSTERGLVHNASAVGYLSAEGEFVPTVLNRGQLSSIYLSEVNPIETAAVYGLMIGGQKTLSPTTDEMDRVNVARLVAYLRYTMANAGRPFIGRPNNKQTADGLKVVLERLFDGLVKLNAIGDYGVDTGHQVNTPERMARKELWAESFIQPINSVEFIYLPTRLTI